MKEEYKLKKNQKLRNMIKKNFVLNSLKLKLNENG